MSDKAVVGEAQEAFDVLVIQANLAVSASRGMSSWRALERPFWIDPITYAFVAAPTYLMSEQKLARGSTETELRYKRTFRALADRYGPPFTTAIEERRSLEPSDFRADRDEVVARAIVEWQRTVLQSPPEDAKYGAPAELEPVLLTVPFFPLELPGEGHDPRWLDVNLRLLRAALHLGVDPDRLAVGLLVEDSLFDDDQFFDRILETYLRNLGEIRHLWFWISENDEVSMGLPRARRLREVVLRATEHGKAVHQAFGGSFSSFLLADEMTSVGHGVTYWERKTWEPIAGGGLPTLRYFYPPLRRRLPVPEAVAAFGPSVSTAEEFHALVCDCQTCRDVVDGDLANFGRFGAVEVRTRVNRWGTRTQYDVPTPHALYLTKLHYLRAKAKEVRMVTEADFDRVAELQRAAEAHTSPFVSTRHLLTWSRALGEP